MASGEIKTLGLLTDSFNAVFVREVLPGLEAALAGKPVRLEQIEMQELSAPEKNRHIERLHRERPEVKAGEGIQGIAHSLECSTALTKLLTNGPKYRANAWGFGGRHFGQPLEPAFFR